MHMMYWDIGGVILFRQHSEGWGAKVVIGISVDRIHEFPDRTGLSPRNADDRRAFAPARPDRGLVQQVVAQIP